MGVGSKGKLLKTFMAIYVFRTRRISDHWFHICIHRSFIYHHLSCSSWYSELEHTLCLVSCHSVFLFRILFLHSALFPQHLSCLFLLTHSVLFLCNPLDCSLPGPSIHGILQVRIQEWVAISSSRGSSWPRDQAPSKSPALAGGFLTTSATWEVPEPSQSLAKIDYHIHVFR